MRICVYCSSSSHLDEAYYEGGYAFGKRMAELGNSLVYGGYCKGIMDAVAKGVHEKGGEIHAVVPDVFSDDAINEEYVTETVRVGSLSERKKYMEDMADAIAILPGGIGTMDEFFEVFVLKSLRQYDKPVVLWNMNGFYDPLMDLLKRFREEGFLKDVAMGCVEVFDDPEKMLEYLMEV